MNFTTELHPAEKSYPRMVRCPVSKSIYLLTGPTTGTKLVQGATGINACSPIGEHRTDWTFTDSDRINYAGTVILNCTK